MCFECGGHGCRDRLHSVSTGNFPGHLTITSCAAIGAFPEHGPFVGINLVKCRLVHFYRTHDISREGAKN